MAERLRAQRPRCGLRGVESSSSDCRGAARQPACGASAGHALPGGPRARRDARRRRRAWLGSTRGSQPGWTRLSCVRRHTTIEAMALLATRHPPLDGYLDRHRSFSRASGTQRATWTGDLATVPGSSWPRPPGWTLPAGTFDIPIPRTAGLGRCGRGRLPGWCAAGGRHRRGNGPDATERLRDQLNHVVHHAGSGTTCRTGMRTIAHVASGRVAAVDSAGRTVMLCAATMAEGWASYVAGLIDGTGFIDELGQCSVRLSELGRSPDHRRHSPPRITLDLRGGRGLPRRGGGYGCRERPRRGHAHQPAAGDRQCLLLGTEQIMRLRATWLARQAENPDLRAFHDRVLEYGSIPVAMSGRSMLAASLED